MTKEEFKQRIDEHREVIFDLQYKIHNEKREIKKICAMYNEAIEAEYAKYKMRPVRICSKKDKYGRIRKVEGYFVGTETNQKAESSIILAKFKKDGSMGNIHIHYSNIPAINDIDTIEII